MRDGQSLRTLPPALCVTTMGNIFEGPSAQFVQTFMFGFVSYVLNHVGFQKVHISK